MFNLRDLEFREYILRNQIFWNFFEFSLFNKKEITDRDLLKFYFEYYSRVKKNGKAEALNIELSRMLFNYKMSKVSKDQLIKFRGIIKKETGIDLINLRLTYYELSDKIWRTIGDFNKFNKLVDIFLDQI
jgi:hypothetical protein